MRRRAYRATDVKNVLVEEVLKTAPAGAATVGLDIGKYELRVVVRWKDGSFERPWKVENPSEIEGMVGLSGGSSGWRQGGPRLRGSV